MKKRILIVEDNPDILDGIAEILEFEGFEISKARNGAVALSLLESLASMGELVDCIVLDYIMPEMDGQEFLHGLSAPALADFQAIPVLVITTNVVEFRQAAARRVDFLPKPVDAQELTDKINRLLARAKESSITSTIS